MIDTKKLDLIAHDLMGQCVYDIEYFCEYYDIDPDTLTVQDYAYIDNIVFNCESCGWWCEAGDYGQDPHDRLICSSCEESSEDE
jgi:hypothetical protein